MDIISQSKEENEDEDKIGNENEDEKGQICEKEIEIKEGEEEGGIKDNSGSINEIQQIKLEEK